MEVAHPQIGSSAIWFLVELEFGNVGFWGDGKTWEPKEKPLGARGVGGESTTSLHPTKLTCISFACSISVFSFMHTLCIYIPSHRTLPRCTNTGLNASLRWKKCTSLSRIKQNKKLMEKLVTSQRACWGFIET